MRMMMVVLNMSTVILNLTLRKGTVHTREVLVNFNNLILKIEHLLYYMYMYIIGMNDIIACFLSLFLSLLPPSLPPSPPSSSPPPLPPRALEVWGSWAVLERTLEEKRKKTREEEKRRQGIV